MHPVAWPRVFPLVRMGGVHWGALRCSFVVCHCIGVRAQPQAARFQILCSKPPHCILSLFSYVNSAESNWLFFCTLLWYRWKALKICCRCSKWMRAKQFKDSPSSNPVGSLCLQLKLHEVPLDRLTHLFIVTTRKMFPEPHPGARHDSGHHKGYKEWDVVSLVKNPAI